MPGPEPHLSGAERAPTSSPPTAAAHATRDSAYRLLAGAPAGDLAAVVSLLQAMQSARSSGGAASSAATVRHKTLIDGRSAVVSLQFAEDDGLVLDGAADARMPIVRLDEQFESMDCVSPPAPAGSGELEAHGGGSVTLSVTPSTGGSAARSTRRRRNRRLSYGVGERTPLSGSTTEWSTYAGSGTAASNGASPADARGGGEDAETPASRQSAASEVNSREPRGDILHVALTPQPIPAAGDVELLAAGLAHRAGSPRRPTQTRWRRTPPAASRPL